MMGILVCRDMTDKVINDEKLFAAEREKREVLENTLKMKDEFLYTMTHEFKTPLTVINAAIQAMEAIYGEQITAGIQKYIDRIRQNSFRQLRLVNNLLDITRVQNGYLKVQKCNQDIVSLTQLIIDSVMPYSTQKGISIHFSSKIKRRVMAVDEEKYERILLNLLSNAIKFSKPDTTVFVTLSNSVDMIRIEVQDQGIGIPADKLHVIFERFGQVDSSLTRQAEGTGIGLSLVKSLVEVLEGRLEVESSEGIGTKFTISLPDKKTKNGMSYGNSDINDKRMLQSVAIEFSDIYY